MSARWPHGDPRDVARAIVADSRYDLRPAPPRQASWFDLVRAWVTGMVRAFFHQLDRALGAHSWLDVAIGATVIAAAFALVGWAVFLLARSFLRAPRARRSRGSADETIPVERSAAALRAAAQAAARAGRYRDAAALLFASAVRALDERGRIVYDPARTPGEYRRLVRDPLFDAFAGDAVVALFAAAEPRDDLYERMSGTYERFFDLPAR
jgi:hypothetical protein